MNIRLTNQINMVGACITTANTTENKAVWTGNPPADFTTDIATLQTGYAAVTAKAALADSATGGAGDAKAQAESALEDAAFILARALANHFKKTGNLDNLGKVDLSKSQIVQLRQQDLLDKTTAIRDLGTATLPESVGTPKEALLVSLNEKGRVDLKHMAGLLDQSVEEFMPDLKGMIFLNPEGKQWETEDQYLSGNVREKLIAADAASVGDLRFLENVAALKSVQPQDLPATEIDVRLGASWLPPSDVQDFVHGLLGVPSGVEVGHKTYTMVFAANSGKAPAPGNSNAMETTRNIRGLFILGHVA